MNYESTSGKIPVAPMSTARSATAEDYRENRQIKRARKILLILLVIQLIFVLFYFIERVINLIEFYDVPVERREYKLRNSYIISVIASALSVVYMNIFIIVVLQYRQLPILICTWLGLIQLICVVIVVVFAIITIVVAASTVQSIGAGIVLSVIIIIAAAVASVLTILTVVFGFRLVNLLKTQQAYELV